METQLLYPMSRKRIHAKDDGRLPLEEKLPW